MKVAVLGGMGLMAEAALHDLAANRRVTEVVAADLNLDRAKFILSRVPNRRKVKLASLDLTDTKASAKKLKGSAVVLNCAWYELNLKAMDLALALHAHYVDLGGLYHMTLKQLARASEFERAGLVGVLGCGSTPGITNLMVARMSAGFETIDTVGIYDASHDPSLSDTAFLPPFSIRTMLDEYVRPAPILEGGRMVEVAAHSGQEPLEFKAPIGRVSAGTVIHSETATLPGFLNEKRVRNVFFKIVYPDSVKRQLALLVGMGLSADAPIQVNGHKVSPRRFVTTLAQQAAVTASRTAVTPQDFEVLRVRITGTRKGRRLEKSWDCEIKPNKQLSAGAIGVGFAGAIAAVMLGLEQGQVRGGVGAPESTLPGEVFFKELRARKSFSLIETIAHPLAI